MEALLTQTYSTKIAPGQGQLCLGPKKELWSQEELQFFQGFVYEQAID